MTANNITVLNEDRGFGSLSSWSMWGCKACGRSIMSASRPRPMFWVRDHQCRFSKIDIHGNIEVEKEFKIKLDKQV